MGGRTIVQNLILQFETNFRLSIVDAMNEISVSLENFWGFFFQEKRIKGPRARFVNQRSRTGDIVCE